MTPKLLEALGSGLYAKPAESMTDYVLHTEPYSLPTNPGGSWDSFLAVGTIAVRVNGIWRTTEIDRIVPPGEPYNYHYSFDVMSVKESNSDVLAMPVDPRMTVEDVDGAIDLWPNATNDVSKHTPVSYTHLTLPTICSV